MLIPVAIAAISAVGQAKSQKDAANYQAEVASNNAKAAKWQAEDAIDRGNTTADNVRRKGAQTLGSQRASMASAGLDIGTGSALSILEDTDYFNQVDQQTVHQNAAREAWGYQMQGSNAQASADLYRSTAGNINPLLEGVKGGAGSYFSNGGSFGSGSGSNTLLTSGYSVDPRWYDTGATIRGRR